MKKLIKALVLLLALGYLATKVDLKSTIALFGTINPLIYILVYVVFLLNLFLSCFKWWLVLREAGVKVSISTAIDLYLQGYVFNFFLPTSIGGDVIKSNLLKQRSGRTFSTVFLATIFDRLSGLVALLSLFSVSMIIIYNEVVMTYLPYLAATLLLVLLVILVIYSWGQPLLLKFVTTFHLERWVTTAHKAWLFIRHRPIFLIKVLTISLVFHTSGMFAHYLLFQSFNAPINYISVLLMLSVARVVESLPISFGGFGLREAVYVFFTNIFSQVTPNQMVVYALLAYTLPFSFIGGFLLLKLVRQLIRGEEKKLPND